MSAYIGIVINTFGCLLSFKVLSQYNHSSFVLFSETSLIGLWQVAWRYSYFLNYVFMPWRANTKPIVLLKPEISATSMIFTSCFWCLNTVVCLFFFKHTSLWRMSWIPQNICVTNHAEMSTYSNYLHLSHIISNLHLHHLKQGATFSNRKW